jgi:hypothetical protein
MEGNLISVNIPNIITVGLMVSLGVLMIGAVSYGVNKGLGRA